MKESLRCLCIDLDAMEVHFKNVPEQVLQKYLGARGLNAWWAKDLIHSRIDPFSPKNPLLISAGILTATAALSSSRIQLTSVSPLTGLLGNSNVGGYWGVELKKKGIISVIITGKAANPVYISLSDSGVVIRSAKEVWGLDTNESRKKIRADLNDEKAQVAVIGQAGENLVCSAAVMFGKGDVAGRTGLGAVLGSKNLKGFAVSKSKRAIRFPKDQIKISSEHARMVTEHESFQEWYVHGDSGQVKWLDDFGAVPAYNYRQPQFEAVDSSNGYRLLEAPAHYGSCYRCPVRCKASITVAEGKNSGFEGERPPFEPMAAWGAKCGNPDVYASVYLHSLCNRWGLDSIEAASLVAYAIDLSQRHILSSEKTENEQLQWGDLRQMENLTREIAFRSSWLGDVLADGIPEAALRIGKPAEKYAFHVKGMAMTSMDPRGFKGTGLGYAISSRGADFSNPYPSLECGYNPRRSKEIFGDEGIGDRFDEEGKGRMVRYTASVSGVLDSLGLCKIPYLSILNDFTLKHPVDLLKTNLNWDLRQEELITAGERIVTLERVINIRLGLTQAMDQLPEKFREEPIRTGICAGKTVDDRLMVRDFYQEMGWNQNGIPLPDRLKLLELEIE